MSIKTWRERVTLPESKLDADDCTLAEIAELRAEVLRLQGEVSDRNLRALEGIGQRQLSTDCTTVTKGC